MKQIKKVFLLLVACCIIASMFLTACATKNDDDSEPTEEIVSQNYYIVAEDEITVNWAAKELADFTKQMNGNEVAIYHSMSGQTTGFGLFLGTAEWAEENFSSTDLRLDELEDDGFVFIPVENGLVVASNYSRGVSYGVYELLERNGVRFYASYELGTYIPENNNVNYQLKQSEVDNPDFGYREIYNDTGSLPITEYGKEEIARLYTWLYRNRYNAVTGHGPSPAYEAGDLIETLGYEISVGGHKFGFPSTYQYPEWRRTDGNGDKVYSGNFCISQPDALMYVAQQVLNTLEQNPGIKRVQLLGEDLYDGGWCHCSECSVYSPNQQFSIVVQVVAEKVGQLYPDVKIQYSLYHDTLDVSDIAVCKKDNVMGFYWPRERCLAHDLQDDTCEKSKTYRNYLETMCSKFKTNSFCGYYGDLVLYNGIEANANAQVASDLKFAKEVGCTDCANLMFSMCGTTMSDEMMMTFARCMWDVDADWKSFVEGYYGDLLGFNQATAQKIMSLRYEYTKDIFSFCGYKVDYGIEGVTISSDEQEWGKEHVLMMLDAEKVIEELKGIYSNAKTSATEEDIISRLDLKLKYAELSRLRGLAVTNITKGEYLKKFVDADFTESYRDCYQTGIDYHRQGMEYAAQFDETVWGHNAYLLQNGLGTALIAFWQYKCDLNA